jgi:hypothetical protein
MRFADMSLDVICKWRPSAGRRRREDEGGKTEAGSGGKRGKKIGGKRWKIGRRWEAVESAGRKLSAG